MTLQTEAILDRRRLRRRISLWRGLAILAGVVMLAVVLLRQDGLALPERKQIARISIEGMISENRDQLRLLRRLAEADQVAGVVVYVNSPGGTTTGGEALYEGLRELAAKKPVVAQFGTVAASAAYIVGLATDHIVARGNTITGSVGVIVQWPEVTDLLAKLGVKMNEVKSGNLKATPSPFQPADEASRKVTEEMIADSYRWFIGLVETRRGVTASAVPGLEQGRIYSGRDALRLKLVDKLGGEREAVNWLETERGVAKGLRVVDWKPQARDWTLTGAVGESLAGMLAGVVRQASLDMVNAAQDVPGLGALTLDGLLSVWHPSKN